MEILILHFNRPIYWKTSSSDPLFYAIEAHPGVELVNPILFPEIERLMDGNRVLASQAPDRAYVGNLCLIETQGIAFRIDGISISRYKPQDVSRFASLRGIRPPLAAIFTPLLSALRHFSKQADLPTGDDDVNVWEWLSPEVLETPVPAGSSNMIRAIATSVVETAITRTHIEQACSTRVEFNPPIFDTLLLDAISAHAAHDYRTSILYSAIALETAAAIVLDDQYENYIKVGDSPAWRVVEFQQAGGKTVRKDPIWYALKERGDANALLHEGALYILQRSLLIDNEPLYQLTSRLRATRNKIVHKGEPPELDSNDQYLSIDIQGSSDALNCADQVIKWLGVGSEYKMHAGGFIELSNIPS